MNMKKEKCNCYNEEKDGLKMYFCPNCNSKKVKPIQGWRNAFGILPRWHCDNCGFENMTFPIIVYHVRNAHKIRISEHPENPKHTKGFLDNKKSTNKTKRRKK